MDPALLQTYLVHILSPLYRILDDDTIRDNLMGRLHPTCLLPNIHHFFHVGDLKTLAQELRELVQKQVGTTKFAEVYHRIRQGVATIRQERKTEKDVQVRFVTLPSYNGLRCCLGYEKSASFRS